MTVVLIGIGADGDNTDPVPPVGEDGQFDYLPIPESYPSSGPTYGKFELANFGESAAEFVDGIRPGGSGDWIQDQETIASKHLHHDPNFEELTYGDIASTSKGQRIQSELSEGDLIGFYTGLQSDYKHRYIIGYFTVQEISEDPASHPDNAHGRRIQAAGTPKHDDVVVVEGKEPGGLLERAYRISEKIDSPPWHRVSADAVESLKITDGQVAVARKPPLTLDIDPDELIREMPPIRQQI